MPLAKICPNKSALAHGPWRFVAPRHLWRVGTGRLRYPLRSCGDWWGQGWRSFLARILGELGYSKPPGRLWFGGKWWPNKRDVRWFDGTYSKWWFFRYYITRGYLEKTSTVFNPTSSCEKLGPPGLGRYFMRHLEDAPTISGRIDVWIHRKTAHRRATKKSWQFHAAWSTRVVSCFATKWPGLLAIEPVFPWSKRSESLEVNIC